MTGGASETRIELRGVSKDFTLHGQGGLRLPVLERADLTVGAGECVALVGPSGSGKSTLMRMIYGNYRCPTGTIRLRHAGGFVDLARASPQSVLELRRRTLGYVSQFLRVVPRVPTLEIVAEPLRAMGVERAEAAARSAAMLARLGVPERLWSLPPATFSGGEQQRVNVARGLAAGYPILLLDEPTASLDAANRDAVLALIGEARGRGAAIVGIFHDAAVREAVATRSFDMAAVRAAA
jgi:alpha-D-ribose 1-methylphosphonate 5-triphosphate synthase subunit PhnL